MVWCRGRRVAGLVVVACVVLAAQGCGSKASPGGEGGSASASGVSSAGDSVSGSASQDELYEEAERVYRAYFELEQQAFLEGGVNGVPLEMNQYIMGWYAESENTILSQMAERKVRMQKGTHSQYTVHRQDPEDAPSDSLVSLTVCIDSTMSPLVDEDGHFVASGYDTGFVFFKYDSDGGLKIYSSKEWAKESCD